MTSRWKRLAALRANLHQQALRSLHAATGAVRDSEGALAAMQAELRRLAGTSRATGAAFQLFDQGARVAADSLDVAAAQREVALATVRRCAVEHRQIARLVEREQEQMKQQQRRHEQRTTDAWTQARRGSK